MTQRRDIAGRSVRWDEARSASARAAGHWVESTLADSLRQAAQETPERVVLVDGTTRLTCAALYAQSLALAQSLAARMPVGSVVSFMLPNWHQAAVIYLGATLAGMVANPILPSLRERELAFILDDVDSRIIFVPASFRQYDYAQMLARVSVQMRMPPEVVVVRGAAQDGQTAYADLFSAHAAPFQPPVLDADAVRMILYTSGTTGQPKGVLHSHNSIHALITQLREHWRVEAGDRFLVPSPIAHIGGSIYAFECPLLLGTTAVLMERWQADEAVALMSAEQCTHMAGATPFLEQLLAAAQKAGSRLPQLKVFICGGASVPPALIERAQVSFERAVVTRVYGSTEVPVTTVGATRDDEKSAAANTDGRAGLAEIRLTEHSAARDFEGEVCARGPQMLVGYLHPEDEASAFDEHGFFRTGDLARFENGYLVVTGRAKDIIIRNGENISPKEIEDLLVSHPGISEIAIVGLPDARTGERACAVIVPKQPPPDVGSLRGYLEKLGVATFKAPEQVVLWEALPKNDAGKVLKHQIRARLREGA